ncbi:MAG: hypothetical protein NTZ65_03965 [Candidatus Berkelbacteria bacterium]|nr:hypothetical protein [Candidatus Berkelbacteria bacterium]
MNKTCKQCSKEFIVEDDDLAFYKKISPTFAGKTFEIPAPTLCPKCRLIRRMIWRNERRLYKANCNLCKKDIVSVYSPNKKFKILCRDCFWSDKWDQFQYVLDYDLEKPFFEQFKTLMKSSYLVNLYSTNCENSEFVNQEMNSKDCYLCTGGNDNIECYYLESCIHDTNCVDCYGVGFSEKVSNSEFCTVCFSSQYLFNCHMCHNCVLCDDCTGCDHCFGSKNLRYQKYHFFNEPLSKDEYFSRVGECLKNPEQLEKNKQRFSEHKLKYPYKYMLTISSTDDCSGDVLMNCKNTAKSYYCYKTENTKYSYILDSMKDVMDILSTGTGELCFDCASSSNIYGSCFIDACEKVRNSYYSFNCTNCHNLFGCVSLNHKEYCILNKQYSKEEYERRVGQIINHMQETGEWGEFLPISNSPFCFNETNAKEHFNLDCSEAKRIGSCWLDKDFSSKYSGPIYTPKALSNYLIGENPQAENEIAKCLQGVLKCKVTGQYFKIIPQELVACIKQRIELPTEHPDQRHKERLAKFNKMNLYSRQCMCEETKHGHNGRCKVEFETTYAPDRPERVYCESCYQKAVI